MEKYKTVVDPVSSDNFRRLFDNDPGTAAVTGPFFQLCLKAKSDKNPMKELHQVRHVQWRLRCCGDTIPLLLMPSS